MGARVHGKRLRTYVRALILAVAVAAVPFAVSQAAGMNAGDGSDLDPPFAGDAYRSDLCTYLVGLALAVILTAIPFALVHWHVMTTPTLWLVVGLFAAVQAVVHFRCFLHVRPPHENVDSMLLVLFTVLILILMSGGTVWILGNLHARMY